MNERGCEKKPSGEPETVSKRASDEEKGRIEGEGQGLGHGGKIIK